LDLRKNIVSSFRGVIFGPAFSLAGSATVT
jgi:hypothetical protein